MEYDFIYSMDVSIPQQPGRQVSEDTPHAFETVIVGGTLIDGTGAPRRPMDIAIRGERIAAVAAPGTLATNGASVLDAGGKIVAPGFIDVHTHDDNAVIKSPEMTPKISQGVTTVIAGNCGISLAPLTHTDCPTPLNILGPPADYRFDSITAYADAVDAARPAVNVALLVGHNTLRVGAMSDLGRKADPAELDDMRDKLDAAMRQGALGFSTGTYYKPSAAADEDEIVALAEIIAPYDGVYATHMRDEKARIFESLEETFSTGRRARVKVVISHHKCASPEVWGRSAETLAVIEGASKTQPVGLDVYPYHAGSTVLDPDYIDERYRIFVSWSDSHPDMVGRDLSDIAEDWGVTQKEAAVRLSPGGGIYFSMDEQDMRRILAHPTSMIGSDGLPKDTNPHPRLWGTFPRVLGHFSRDEGLFDLETAIFKMTGLSAANFNMRDRGVVRAGAFADLVVFDADAIADRATYEDPKRLSAGIEAVFVNGRTSWVGEQPTGERAGRFLRHRRDGAAT